jgi:hypothetical protein
MVHVFLWTNKFWHVGGSANVGSQVKYDMHLNVCIKSLPAHDMSQTCSVWCATVQFAVKDDREESWRRLWEDKSTADFLLDFHQVWKFSGTSQPASSLNLPSRS